MFIDDYWRMFVHYCVVCWNIVVLKSDLYFDICWSYLEKFFMFLTPYVKNALLFVERYADKAVDLLVLGVCAVFTILNNYLIKAKNFLAPYVKTGLLFVNGKRGLVVKFLTPYLVRFASTMFGKKFLYYCGEFKSLLKEIFSFP